MLLLRSHRHHCSSLTSPGQPSSDRVRPTPRWQRGHYQGCFLQKTFEVSIFPQDSSSLFHTTILFQGVCPALLRGSAVSASSLTSNQAQLSATSSQPARHPRCSISLCSDRPGHTGWEQATLLLRGLEPLRRSSFHMLSAAAMRARLPCTTPYAGLADAEH